MMTEVLPGLFLASALAILGSIFFLLSKLRAGSRKVFVAPFDRDLIWTVSQGLLLAVLVIAAAVLIFDRSASSPPAFVVKVTGYQFGWRFDYYRTVTSTGDSRLESVSDPRGGRAKAIQFRSLNVSTTDLLVLPQNAAILFLATSSDVIHQFWVPEFQIRRDLVPGFVSPFLVHPSRTGRFLVQSDPLCKAAPGLMSAPVNVVDPNGFQEWLAHQQRSVDHSDTAR